jgi:hypothetical protein
MKKLIVISILAMVMVSGLAWAGEKETLQQRLGANVEAGQKLALRQQEIQTELGEFVPIIKVGNFFEENMGKVEEPKQQRDWHDQS